MWPKKTHDVFVERWNTAIAGPDGKIPRSRLRPPRAARRRQTTDATLQSVSFEVDVPGALPDWAYKLVSDAQHTIAHEYGRDLSQIRVDRLLTDRRGRRHPHVRLTIAEAGVWNPDALTDEGPQVEDGLIAGLCRDQNGERKLPVRMYDPTGMVATVLLGDAESSRALAGWDLAAAALASGVMNLILVDPKRQAPTALRQAARVVVSGKDYAAQAATIVSALIDGRGNYAAANELDQLTPGSPGSEPPAWMVLHTDVESVHGWQRTWERTFMTFRSHGIWPVFVAESSPNNGWAGSQRIEALFHGQTIHVPSPNGVDSPAGNYPPLPRDVTDVRAQLERFARVPELADVDVKTLTDLLGGPVDGRWTIGPAGKHTVPITSDASGARMLIVDEFPEITEGVTGAGKSVMPSLAALLSNARGGLQQRQTRWRSAFAYPSPVRFRTFDETSLFPSRTPTGPVTEPTPASSDDANRRTIAGVHREALRRALDPFLKSGVLKQTGPGTYEEIADDDQGH